MRSWRVFFLASSALILIGGPRHPGGTMVEMLAHPDWVPSHAMLAVAFAALAAGLVLYRRSTVLPARTARWSRIALWGTVFQFVEMVLHTASAVDAENLAAGRSTPILNVHLAMAVVAYPVFGATFISFIVASARERTMASPWVAPLGVIGAAAHGVAAPLAILLQSEAARALFPMLMLLAAWLLLAAVWPLRTGRAAPLP